MKKYGKYERMPDGSRAKQPEMKSVLLQTYFTSLVCLLLCVTMFFGTTYAWFTSEVTNTGNEIYIGVLDVELMKQIPDSNDEDTEPDFVSLSGKKDDGSNTYKLFGDDVRWEPGYTAVETVKIVDKGDLAFNYELTFTDGKVTGTTTAELQDVAKWFDVWVFDHQAKTYSVPAAYAAITEENGWTKVGTLADVLNGKAVLSGGMDTAAVTADKEAEHKYTIALHMNGENAAEDQQEALNALMGQKIELSVKLVATQRSSETDGFGSSIYDAGTVVADAAQLKAALEAGESAVLMANIDMNGVSINIPATGKVVLDLNGYTLTSMDGGSGNNWAIKVDRGANFTLNDSGDDGQIVASCYGIYVQPGATFIMNGGTITVSNNGVYDIGVTVWNSEFVMNGGKIDARYGIWASDYWKNQGQDVPNCKITVVEGSEITAIVSQIDICEASTAIVDVPENISVVTEVNEEVQ